MKPKTLLCLALDFSLVCAMRVLAGDASLTDTPKFSVLEFPEPPSQHKPWTPPATDLPTNLVSSAKVLFDFGLADPRDCEYREFETITGWDRSQTNKITAHGWILPARSGLEQTFAVGWDGLLYPVVEAGKKAGLEQDIQALLRADELWRKTAPTNLFGLRWMFPSQKFFMSQTNMAPIKVALLLRLGEGKLAQEYWKAWRAVENTGESKEDINDPFREFASEWAYGRFDRAISAFMRANDALALADLRQLNHLWPELEKEAIRRGFSQSLDEKGQARPFFEFLKLAPGLLADEERRAKEPPHQSVLHIGLDKFPDKSKRIAALISDLDQASDRQVIHPGSVWMDFDLVVAALVAEGDGAVDPLLDCLEKDHRLTRSADLGNDFRPCRIVPVRDGAQAALDGILKVHFDSNGDYRAYWQKYKGLPLSERWYQTLLDDQAGRKQWMQAAKDILGRTDGKEVYDWGYAPIPDATNGYGYAGETLRAKTEPSIADLFLKRALEIAPTNYLSFADCWTFQDAADLGLMLAEWDAKSASAALEKIIQRCPALIYDKRESWGGGFAVVPAQFARLAVALANLGNTSGLDLYAKWVRDCKLSDLHDALPAALLPLGHFPNHPSIKEASVHLFRPENGAWLDNQTWCDLLGTRLLLNQPFRLLILSALTNKTSAGTVVLKENRQFEIDVQVDNHSEGGILEPDAFAPGIGQTVSFRVCDNVARRLSRIEGLPLLRLYWPESKRDNAVADIIKFLQKNGDNLILKPASWPMSNND